MKTIYCKYNPNNHLYYCSTKTPYGSLFPEACELILDHDSLYEFIKNNYKKYKYSLPCLVANDFEIKLRKDGINEKNCRVV